MQPNADHLDPSASELAYRVNQSGRSGGHRDSDPACVHVDRWFALADPAKCRRYVVKAGDLSWHDLEGFTTHLDFELVRCPLCDHLAAVDHSNRIRQLVGLLRVLGSEQQHGARAHERIDDGPHLQPTARVQAGGRLVKKHHRRVGHQRARQVEAATHTPGIGRHRPVASIGELEALKELHSARLRGCLAHVKSPPDHVEVLSSGEAFIHGWVLPRQPDPAAHLNRISQHVDPGDDGAPGIWGEQCGENSDCRRLPGDSPGQKV